jgi:hypothetical protein
MKVIGQIFKNLRTFWYNATFTIAIGISSVHFTLFHIKNMTYQHLQLFLLCLYVSLCQFITSLLFSYTVNISVLKPPLIALKKHNCHYVDNLRCFFKVMRVIFEMKSIIIANLTMYFASFVLLPYNFVLLYFYLCCPVKCSGYVYKRCYCMSNWEILQAVYSFICFNSVILILLISSFSLCI